MKTTKNFLAATVAVAALNVALAADASGNDALRHSPRYLEEHPAFRFAWTSGEQTIVGRPNEIKRTENKALAASPRFREEHPELLRVEPSFEIAPLK